MQCSTTLIQQLIAGLTFWTTALVHAQTACQPSTTDDTPKSLIQTQINLPYAAQKIIRFKTQLNDCEFSAADKLTVGEFTLNGDAQKMLSLISIDASGPQSLVRVFGFSCDNCSTQREGLDLRITETVNAYANNNNNCKPNYVVQTETRSILLQTLNGCKSLRIEHLVELVQTGPVRSANPYVFNTSLASFKLSRNLSPPPTSQTIPLNSKALLISPCKVVIRRKVQRL
jgi:hypothetical protein